MCRLKTKMYNITLNTEDQSDRFYSLLTAILATIVITAILTSLQYLP